MAGLAQKYPGLVAFRCMSYLQEGAPAAAPLQNPSPRPALSVEALPSTHADVQTPARPGGPGAAAGCAADGVPRITFLYKLVPGVADRSFGAPSWSQALGLRCTVPSSPRTVRACCK